jgi:hypothetical protein
MDTIVGRVVEVSFQPGVGDLWTVKVSGTDGLAGDNIYSVFLRCDDNPEVIRQRWHYASL